MMKNNTKKSLSKISFLIMIFMLLGTISIPVQAVSINNHTHIIDDVTNVLADTSPYGTFVDITETGSYALFNSGATSSTGRAYSTGGNGSNPDCRSFTNSGYDIYGDSPTNTDLTRGLGLSFKISSDVTENATLTIYAYDIDEERNQIDDIYLVNDATGKRTFVGNLQGRDETWSTTTITIPANYFEVGQTYHFEVDICMGGWWTWVRRVSLEMTMGEYIPTTILNYSFNGSIDNNGRVSTNLNLTTDKEIVYYLEYTATINGEQKGGTEGKTITATTSGASVSTSFNLESGAPKGIYEIRVILKDSSGNTKASYSFSAGYNFSAVTYDANGGSQNLPTDSTTYSNGDNVTVKFDYTPSRYGYTFLGWSTDRNATTPMYTSNGTKTFTIGSSDVTLYAVWLYSLCNHEWTETSRTNATCTTDGLVIKTCSLCGETEQTTITSPGHIYLNGFCTVCKSPQPSADDWDGTVDTSWYNTTDTSFTIYTAEELAGLAQLVNNGDTFSGKTITLANNIDLADKEWTPIGKGILTTDYNNNTQYQFRGTFDGNYHIVSNLKITHTTTTYTGLFGDVQGTIKNLGIDGVNISSITTTGYRSKCGSLVGRLDNGHVSNCYVIDCTIYNTTTSNPGSAGGLIGNMFGSIVENCYAQANVSCNGHVAVLIGSLYNSAVTNIKNCYAVGTAKNIGSQAGGTVVCAAGIIAFPTDSSSNVNVSNSFFDGMVDSSVTENTISWGNNKNCYYNITQSVSHTSGQSTSSSNFKSQSWITTNLGWDFNTVWEFKSGSDYPVLQGFGNGSHSHRYVETSRTNPTCTSYGIATLTCNCGAVKTDILYPTQHNYQITNTVAATCTTDGYIEFTCQTTGCTSTKRQHIERLGHYFGNDNECDRCKFVKESHDHVYTSTVIAPTCSSMGYTEYTCSCGYSYRGDYIEQNRHNWDAGTVTTAATCTTNGVMTYSCQDCSAIKTTIIPAAHQWTQVITLPKTCTTDGTLTKTCSVCSIEVLEIIPAGHDWDAGVETLAATCETDGSKTCTCTSCNTTQSFVIPALGHTYVDGVCTRCNEEFITNVTPSTHPIYGMYFEINDIVSDYGPSLIDEYGVMLDYNTGANIEKVAVYLTQDGTMWRRCIAVKGTNIQYATYVPYLSYKSEIKYTGLNHDWINIFQLSQGDNNIWCYNDYTTIGANLQDANGNLLLSLYDIGQAGTQTRIFDDLDEMITWLNDECFEHTPSDWIIDTPASCIAGSKHKVCTVCDKTIATETIAPIEDHISSSWIVDVQPTDTQTGSRHKACISCGTVLVTEVMPTLAKITIDNIEVEAGHRVKVAINIQNNPGIVGASLFITYDPYLSLVDVEAGRAFSSLNFTVSSIYSNPCTFVWDGLNTADTSNGTLLILTFEVPANANLNTVYNITASYTSGNIVNGELEAIDVMIENGSIKTINTIGDVNDDGIVNVADVITLRRYIAGGFNVTIDQEAADINDDGSITVADIVALRRLLVA